MTATNADRERALAWLSRYLGGFPVGTPDRLHIAGREARVALEQAFAAARAEEREQCAKVADEAHRENEARYAQLERIQPNDMGTLKYACYSGEDERIAAAIRART